MTKIVIAQKKHAPRAPGDGVALAIHRTDTGRAMGQLQGMVKDSRQGMAMAPLLVMVKGPARDLVPAKALVQAADPGLGTRRIHQEYNRDLAQHSVKARGRDRVVAAHRMASLPVGTHKGQAMEQDSEQRLAKVQAPVLVAGLGRVLARVRGRGVGWALGWGLAQVQGLVLVQVQDLARIHNPKHRHSYWNSRRPCSCCLDPRMKAQERFRN